MTKFSIAVIENLLIWYIHPHYGPGMIVVQKRDYIHSKVDEKVMIKNGYNRVP